MDDSAALQPTSRISGAERAAREDLAACYRLVADYGWDDLAGTHISHIVPGEEAFLLNPLGIIFEQITASCLMKISFDGEVLEKTSYALNAAAFTIHSAVHQARRDVGCVIHLHTQHGMAVSALEEGLLPLTQSAAVVMDDLVYHDYEGIALNLEERERLQRDLGDHNMMILRNHGTLVVGDTAAQAFKRLYMLEKACEMQCLTLGMGRPLRPMPPEALTQIQSLKIRSTGHNDLMWEGLRQRLEGREPSYRS